MATLDDAAEELANTLKELDHALEESQQALLSFGDKLVSDTQRIEDGWPSLADRVDAFLRHLPELARRMDDGVQEAGQALTDLQGGIAADDSAAEAAASAARDSVAGLEEHLREVREPLETVVAGQVEAPLEELARRAESARASLDEALAGARAFLEEDLASALAAVAEQIRTQVEDVCEGPLKECGEEVQEAYETWQQSLGVAEELILEKSYAAAPGHAQQVVEYAIGQCGSAYDEALGELQRTVEVVEEALRGLQEEAAQRAAALREEGQEELSSGHRELLQAMADAGRALDAVKQLLASFTFVQL